MSEIQDNQTVSSNEAFELLECFNDGIDEMVYSIAEKIAQERGKNDDGFWVIEKKDVAMAGKQVLSALKALVDNGKYNEILQQTMESCFDEKTCDTNCCVENGSS